MGDRALLEWYVAIGVDEAIGEQPIDRTATVATQPGGHTPARAVPPPLRQAPQAAAPARPAVAAAPRPAATAPSLGGVAAANARTLAESCRTLEELAAAVQGFDGCALKATATRTVFGDGNPAAPVMLIGEAPGAEEDRLGRAFVGPAGQLLDRMLASIGLDRASTAYITNVLFWRPPGNRAPTPAEIQICLPFVERHVALAAPKVLVLLGATSGRALLDRVDGINRFRGRWFDYRPPGGYAVPAIATFHPSFLLRSPAQKREAWKDLIAIKIKLQDLGALERRA